MLTATVTTTIAIAGGPSLAFKYSVAAADCYDFFDIVAAKGTPTTVEIGAAAGVTLLAVTAADADYAATLTFSPATGSTGAPFTLDQPLLFADEALRALGPSPDSLVFTNTGAKDVGVKILVLRDSTPAAAPAAPVPIVPGAPRPAGAGKTPAVTKNPPSS